MTKIVEGDLIRPCCFSLAAAKRLKGDLRILLLREKVARHREFVSDKLMV